MNVEAGECHMQTDDGLSETEAWKSDRLTFVVRCDCSQRRD